MCHSIQQPYAWAMSVSFVASGGPTSALLHTRPQSPNSGLPADYSALTGLRLVGLASMDLEAGPVPSSGFPQEWSSLVNLQQLDLSNNRCDEVMETRWGLGDVREQQRLHVGACSHDGVCEGRAVRI